MRRRILVAIVAVTALATLALTVPLSLIISRREHADALLELDRVSQRALIGVAGRTGPNAADEPIELPEAEASITLGVYSPDGRRIAGNGPARADPVTAGVGPIAESGTVGTDLVLASPVVVDEVTEAVIRVSEPVSEAEARVRHDLGLLVLFNLAAVGLAAAVGWFVAARLSKPIRSLRNDAVRLGEGDFSIDALHSGVSELDETADALASTAARLDEMLSRERAFSANASHELRTPLAALRLAIETELLDHRDDPDVALREALVQIDRLSGTISTLLDVARDRPVTREQIDIERLKGQLLSDWKGVFVALDREFVVTTRADVVAHVSEAVLNQILAILLSNAADHGRGTVHVDASISGGGVAVTISDEGRLDRDQTDLFSRRDPGAVGHGVGLSLARSLAEAEGGRLVLSGEDPTTFLLVMPDTRAGAS